MKKWAKSMFSKSSAKGAKGAPAIKDGDSAPNMYVPPGSDPDGPNRAAGYAYDHAYSGDNGVAYLPDENPPPPGTPPLHFNPGPMHRSLHSFAADGNDQQFGGYAAPQGAPATARSYSAGYKESFLQRSGSYSGPNACQPIGQNPSPIHASKPSNNGYWQAPGAQGNDHPPLNYNAEGLHHRPTTAGPFAQQQRTPQRVSAGNAPRPPTHPHASLQAHSLHASASGQSIESAGSNGGYIPPPLHGSMTPDSRDGSTSGAADLPMAARLDKTQDEPLTIQVSQTWPEVLKLLEAAAAAAPRLTESAVTRLEQVKAALKACKAADPPGCIMRQYLVNENSPMHEGHSSVTITVLSSYTQSKFAIKYYADVDELRRERALLDATPSLTQITPMVRQIEPECVGAVLEGGHVISVAGKSLRDILDERHIGKTHIPLDLFKWMVSVLDTLQTSNRTHGNITPGHILVDQSEVPATFNLVDLSCSRRAQREEYAPWGAFNVRYAAPEAVVAALTRSGTLADHASDLWPLGIILYEVKTGRPYWPPAATDADIVECLLGFKGLPHERDVYYLKECGDLKTVVKKLLRRNIATRLSVGDMTRLLAEQARDAVKTMTLSGGPKAKEMQAVLQRLDALNSNVGCVYDRVGSVGNDVYRSRQQLDVIHQMTVGQALNVTLQVWKGVPGQGASKRQLAPTTLGSVAAGNVNVKVARQRGGPVDLDEPVYELLAGESYYFTVLVQHRDLNTPIDMPISSVSEIRIRPESSPHAESLKGTVLEHSGSAFWMEAAWVPAKSPFPQFRDPAYTSPSHPGQCMVHIYLEVPHMESRMKLNKRIRFNLNPPGTRLAIQAQYARVWDFLQNPQTAKAETLKTGIFMLAKFSGTAFGAARGLMGPG